MWRMLLPYYLLFLISIVLFLKTDIRIIIGERSEPLSMVFNDQPRDIYIYMADVRPYVRF